MTTTTAGRSPAGERSGRDSAADDIADGVDDAVDEHPVIERLTRLGWIAKGVVYLLMGATAVSIARQEPTDDQASPTGSLAKVIEQPGGRFLLGVLAVGLALYSVWRILSVAIIRGTELRCWLERVGYAFSAAFYAVLTWVAARTSMRGREGGRDNTVERLSRSLMESGWGRWAVGIGGVVTLAVGIYFVVRKGIMRSFVDDLRGVHRGTNDETVDHLLVVSGVAGWIGRGVVTILVGFFVTRAAVRFDPDDARGFDDSLRHVATTSTGTVLVWCAAIGLVLYGAFCLLSHARRKIEDNS
jgi:hypothetical protein